MLGGDAPHRYAEARLRGLGVRDSYLAAGGTGRTRAAASVWLRRNRVRVEAEMERLLNTLREQVEETSRAVLTAAKRQAEKGEVDAGVARLAQPLLREAAVEGRVTKSETVTARVEVQSPAEIRASLPSRLLALIDRSDADGGDGCGHAQPALPDPRGDGEEDADGD